MSSKKGKKQHFKEDIIRNGQGKFNFPNGDSYEGEYIVINGKEIYRHGYGVYRTNDGDEYQTLWDRDSISSSLHIRYSNKAEYDGQIDSKGAMSGNGIYTFPDGTTLNATWVDNEPDSDFIYKDPLGYRWLGKVCLVKQEIIFSPKNQIWMKYVN